MRLASLIVLMLLLAPAHGVLAVTPVATQSADGAALYVQYCKPCHGADMKGYAADNAPSLVSPTFLETADDGFLHAAIERGRAGTAMGGYGRRFGGPLDEIQINRLINLIRGNTKPKPSRAQPTTGNAALGEVLYRTRCESCHGTPQQRGNAVHLANAMFLETASDSFLRTAIARGRPGTAMLAWDNTLTASQIEDVVAYIRAFSRPVPPPVATEALLSLENKAIVINPKGAQATLSLRDNRYVSVADVAKAYKDGRRLVLVDARTPSDYLRLHIDGAISIPYFDMRDLDKIPNDGTWVVAYCACPHHVSGIVMEELRKRGYANSAVLDEGLFVWQQQGHPVMAAPGQLPIPAPPAHPGVPAPHGSGPVKATPPRRAN